MLWIEGEGKDSEWWRARIKRISFLLGVIRCCYRRRLLRLLLNRCCFYICYTHTFNLGGRAFHIFFALPRMRQRHVSCNPQKLHLMQRKTNLINIFFAEFCPVLLLHMQTKTHTHSLTLGISRQTNLRANQNQNSKFVSFAVRFILYLYFSISML